MNPYEHVSVDPLQDLDGYQGKMFHSPALDLPYRISLPDNWKDGSLHPVVFIMHGMGSIGKDNAKQLFLARLFSEHETVRKNSPILVAPQCPEDDRWVDLSAWNAEKIPLHPEPTKALGAVLKLMDFILSEYPVDFSRIYAVGASMGGFATWQLLFRRPGLFAAAIIICGGADPKNLKPIGMSSIALFHGDVDGTVPVENSRSLADRMNSGKWDFTYTEYPGIGHDAWTPALSDEATYEWLFSKKQRYFSTMDEIDPTVLKLSASGMTAEISPAAGGNLYSLRHTPTGQHLLREPHRVEELFLGPERFGIPVLFPPNRIDGGRFTFHGRSYQLPVTEVFNNNHLHGLAVNRRWEVIAAGSSSAMLRYHFTKEDERFEGFPHEFELIRTYTLFQNGLKDSMTVRNLSGETMPLGLGYHTAFPADSVVVHVGVSPFEIEVGARVLPTGRAIPWAPLDPSKPFNPFGHSIGFHSETGHLSLPDGGSFLGAELTYKTGVLRYYLDEKFRFWYTWNSGGLTDFLCLEPVSWMSNALNMPYPKEKTGILELAPGASEIFTNRFEFSR